MVMLMVILWEAGIRSPIFRFYCYEKQQATSLANALPVISFGSKKHLQSSKQLEKALIMSHSSFRWGHIPAEGISQDTQGKQGRSHSLFRK